MKQCVNFLLLCFIFLNYSCADGKQPEPISIAQQVYASGNFDQLKQHIGGEIAQDSMLLGYAPNLEYEFRLLEQTEKDAVVNVTATDPTLGKGKELYLFFDKNNNWQLTAIRSLAMTNMIEQIANMPDSVMQQLSNINIEESEGLADTQSIVTIIKNAQLIIDLDDNIIKHFEKHSDDFEKLKDEALLHISHMDVAEDATITLNEDLIKDYEDTLLITNIVYNDYEISAGALIFSIGGMGDNTVGYLFQPNEKNVPKMNKNSLIMLREIGNGWYLYKTT